MPTFVAFTPWTTIDGYIDLLDVVADLDLVAHVAPVQWGIRLLVTWESRLLELPDIQSGDRSVRREDADLSVDSIAIRASTLLQQQVMALAGVRADAIARGRSSHRPRTGAGRSAAHGNSVS